MDRINLFFDCKIFIERFFTNSLRSGLVFVAWNVLKTMHKNESLQITLAYPSRYAKSRKLRKLKEHPFFSQFKFACAGAAETSRNLLRLIESQLKEKIYYKEEYFKNAQVYLSPYFPIPRKILEQKHIKKIYILHDTIPVLPKTILNCNYEDGIYFFEMMRKTFDKDIYSFCVSQSCKDDYLKYCGDKLDTTKMFVTHNAASQDYAPNYDKQELACVLKKYKVKHNPNDQYLFSLCSLEPRKNIPFTISCFLKFIKKHNIQNLYFYLGGSTWNSYDSAVLKTLEDVGEFKCKVKLLGYIDDSDLNILYSNSLFFTFLSQYEGFGMPPLEAMQAGTPVIASNNSSLPEVVGDAAISVICNDESAVIKAFEDFYFNENLRKEYIAKGLERAKMFSWEKCVGQMIHSIEEVVK